MSYLTKVVGEDLRLCVAHLKRKVANARLQIARAAFPRVRVIGAAEKGLKQNRAR